MRTRKLLLPIVLLCVTVVGLALCQEKRWPRAATKHRDKSAKGKVGYANSEEDLQDVFNHSSWTSDDDAKIADILGIRNNRAIGNSTRSTDVGSKTNQQSSQSSNLPKSHAKSSEEVGREKVRRYKNMTIGDGICQSIDIRNDVNSFIVLKDCRVIEGFLQIVLIENNTEADFENVSFPELREITGYFLLYRVDGLKSLNKLFPNLEVIRGDILLTDFTLMIYEMKNLQEIGLTNLAKISRGGVRIEKNPALCFTNTVNWSLIVPSGESFIKDNRIDNCPHVKGCTQCPGGYCWTAQHCQKLERPNCHEQCLGECYGPSDTECYVCKHYRHDGKCIERCPPNLYAYLSRRCISKDECLNMNHIRRFSKMEDINIWRPFKDSCVTQCPDGFEDYIDDKNVTGCRGCSGQCRKIEKGAIIRHISDAQSFRGITVVKGALEFQIRNGNPNIMNELADAFGLIEEISEYLKITHSFPITSLSFLKKLKVIKGENLDINNASLVVLDNPNLSSLFPLSQNITIENGRLFFHYNPKLCLSKIEQFGKMVNITNFTDLEVQPESNGEKVACNIVNINITVKKREADRVMLSWDSYKPPEGQQLLNYLLNYIEAKNEDITYEANACGNNTWQIVDVGIPNLNSIVSKNITNLKPYTKYAAYVKTFTARNKKNASNSFVSPVGQSEIIFFQTKSTIPSVPTNVSSKAISDSEILLKWSPPVYPNGPIGYYMISSTHRSDDAKLVASRDYCVDTLDNEAKKEIHEATTSLTSNPNSCSCFKDRKISKQFEIFCHTNITLSHLSPGWKDYCVFNSYNSPESKFYDVTNNLFTTTREEQKTGSDVSANTGSGITISHLNDEEYTMYNVSARNTLYILKNLSYYSLYTITIAACGVKMDSDEPMCSTIQYTNVRTLKRPSADDVHNVKVQVTNNTIVKVVWESVKDPNAFTVSYTIEYTNLDVKDAKKSTECIPYIGRREKHISHYIRNLSPGRYSLRIRSTSLAGDGVFTDVVYFSVGLSDNNRIMIATLLTLIVLVITVTTVILFIRNHQKKKTQERLIASVNPDYIETKYVVDSWEVPRENVEILEELGLGNFGMVYRGYLDGTGQVAIKTISETASQREKNEFLNEASVMKNFSTWHIIKLLGVVSMGNPPFVIMELMENGDLKTYLRRIRDTQMVPNASRIMRMAAEIADGMAYLESKKFVHRDLAARNCMVSKDLVCKIGDFGMARDIYETDYYKIGKKGLLPIRWMAPENLSDGVFTSDSDVWSFGVVLYEILTLAEIPYQGFSNEEVLHHVLRKGMLNLPRNCPETIQKIMEKCFKWRPSERPTFMEIVSELEPFLGQDFCEKSFYHSDEGIEIRSLGIKKVYHNAAPIRFHWGHETARWVKDFEDNVTLLDQMKAGTSRARIFKNGFQHFGNVTNFEDVPLDR
ncbi:PREDICTED: insulin receptor-like [Vollenhovia emeryi]|uniref:insulin receptor-like n=1 Tax=Vollenhovia emeryi TaxID=411798 RepID=UPI0005F36D24|nr:PREDICTED: insulin receptor-like [Vollenhovia emeryi]XP_011882701.1 PREDICTED: insulin receptor-like [Vollenhovia emeryi]XP_011882702.1 PREDICTED: insulin receptor-like [Vollenhovia emeryi]XP_011882704.1 PREDICTED: insulin receptor-like [Vollenhovia emeryi]